MLDKFAKDKKLLWGFIILLWLNFSIFAALTYFLHKKHLINTAVEQLQIKTEITGSTLKEWMTARSSIVTSLANEIAELPESQRTKIPASYFDRVTSTQLLDFLGYALEDGFYHSNPWDIPPNYQATQRPWYTQSKSVMQPTVSRPYLSIEDNKSTFVAFTAPIINKQQFLGVVSGDVSFDRIYHQIINTKLVHKGAFNLISREGIIILKKANQTEETFFSQDINQETLLRRLNPTASSHYVGENKIFSFYPLEYNQWWLAAEIDKNYVLTPAKRELRNVLLLFIIIAISTYLLQKLYAWRVFKPILNQLQTDFDSQLPNKNKFLEQFANLCQSNVQYGLCILIEYKDFSSLIYSFRRKGLSELKTQGLRRVQNTFSNNFIVGSIAYGQVALFMPFRQRQGEKFVRRKLNQLYTFLNAPYQIDGKPIVTPVRFSVATYPDDGQPNTILNKAHIALDSLQYSRENFQIYHYDVGQQLAKQSELVQALHQAISNDELHLVYQPQIHTLSNTIHGVEVLSRWHSSKLNNIISPQVFVAIAESNGLIRHLTLWVTRTLFKQINLWKQQHCLLNRYAINFSSINLHDDVFIEEFFDLIEQYQIDPKLLEVEITEHIALEDFTGPSHGLQLLKEKGISISVDDFGTGYSSLNYLKRLPINTLKVDRSFIRSLPQNKHDAALTKAIIDITKEFELNIIAEGVETKEQLDFLQQQQCYIVQGYLFAQPLLAQELVDFINEWQ